jgi:hypothetical protein
MRGRVSYRRVDDAAAKSEGVRNWLQKPLFWSCVVGVAYFLFTLAVTAVEVFSEMSKLSRGFFSNTFSPFFFTHLLTFPTSVVHSDWPGYPEVFDEAQWKSIVWHALGPVVLTVAIQTVLVVAVVWLLVSLIRWVRPQPWTT